MFKLTTEADENKNKFNCLDKSLLCGYSLLSENSMNVLPESHVKGNRCKLKTCWVIRSTRPSLLLSVLELINLSSSSWKNGLLFFNVCNCSYKKHLVMLFVPFDCILDQTIMCRKSKHRLVGSLS